MRFQPIFGSNKKFNKPEKIKEITNLLQKKHLMDRSLQISLERMQSHKREDPLAKSFKIKSNLTIKKKT